MFRIDLNEEFLPQNLGLPQAKNIFEFVISPDYLGLSSLYPLQFETLRDFFEEYCPDCSGGKDDISSLKLMEFGICPQCNKSKLDFYKDGRVRFFNEIIGVAGTKSGKTTLVGGIIAPYLLHKVLFKANIIRDILGLIPWETLVFVFNATSREQAQLTGWDHFISTLKNSLWFKRFFEAIKQKAKALKTNSDEFFSETATKIEFKFAKLLCGCFHSNAFSLAGGTFYFVMIDELSRFERSESRRSASEIVRVTKNNLFPVRNGFMKLLQEESLEVNLLYDGILAMISAPLYEDDKTMQLLEGAKVAKRRFVFYRSTFDANVDADRNVISVEEEEDPEGIARDFDAIPSTIGEKFIGDISILNRVCEDNEKLLNWDIRQELAGWVGGKSNIRLILNITDIIFNKTKVVFIHADPGRVRDSFGIAIASARGDRENYEIIIHEIIEVRPQFRVKAIQEVDFESIFEALRKVSENLTIRAISFDRWNSISHIQRLRDLGLLVEDINLKYDDFLVFKQDLIQGKIKFPIPEVEDWHLRNFLSLPPISKALKEIYSLRDFGRKVDHPPSGSSDLAVCCVGVHRLVLRYYLGIGKFTQGIQGMIRNNVYQRVGRVVRLGRFR